MRSSIDQRFAVTPTDDLTVEHQVLWSDGLRPANRPVDPDNVGHVWAAVSDHEADLHVLVVEGPGSSFSWSTAVCVVRGRSAVWTMTGPGIGMAELFAALDDPETRPADVPADVVAARLTTRRSTRTPPRSARLRLDNNPAEFPTVDSAIQSVYDQVVGEVIDSGASDTMSGRGGDIRRINFDAKRSWLSARRLRRQVAVSAG